MNLARFALNKSQFVVVVSLLIAIFGFAEYFSISRAEDPGFIIRNALVVTALPGAPPEKVDLLVTEKLERKIREMHEVEEVLSESKTGVSIINVKIFDKYTNVREIWDKLRRKVSDAKVMLPNEAFDPIVNDEYGDVYGLIYGVKVSESFTYEYVYELLKELKRQLLLNSTIGKVDIEGMQDERIFIKYNQSKLSELGLTPTIIATAVSNKNAIRSGGVINNDRSSIALETNGQFQSIEDIKNVRIPISKDIDPLKLSDIADIYHGYIDPPTYQVKYNGENILGIAISMAEGGNIIKLDKNVDQIIKNFELSTMPIGLEIKKIWSQAFIVKDLVRDFVSTLIQSIAIVCIVLVAFLGLRIGVLVSMMIPMIVLVAIAFMPFFNITLNQISLAALIVALGMLVDNSVVISESIVVKSSASGKLVDSILETISELSLPLLISTTVVVTAFLPIYLSPSQLGEYTGELFMVVALCLYCSLIMSMLFVPVASRKIIKIPKKSKEPESNEKNKMWSKEFDNKFYGLYRSFLCYMLVNKYKVFFLIIFFTTSGIYSAKFVTRKFLPFSDLEFFTAEIELPSYASFKYLDYVIKDTESYIVKDLLVNKERKEGISNWITYLGGGGPRYRLVHDPEISSINYGFMFFTATSEKIVDSMIEKIGNYLSIKHQDSKVRVRRLEMGSPVAHPVELRIYGNSLDKVKQIVDKIKSKLESIEGTYRVTDDFGLLGEKINLNINDFGAAKYAFFASDIASSMSASINGIHVSDLRQRDEIIPIFIKSDIGDSGVDIEADNHLIYSKTESLPLSYVAKVKSVWAPSKILRSNGYRYIQAVSELKEGYTAHQIVSAIKPYLLELEKDFPPGFRWEFKGEQYASDIAMSALATYLPLASVIIFLLLMFQFNCIRRVIVILFAFPLGLVGAIIGLLLTNSYIGFMTVLGIIALAGILFNNAIVLLDRISLESKELPMDWAIVLSAQSRARPIFLTAVSTILGMMPLWFFGSILFKPLAISVIFGLTFGIIVTLALLPIIFAVFLNIDCANLENYLFNKKD